MAFSNGRFLILRRKSGKSGSKRKKENCPNGLNVPTEILDKLQDKTHKLLEKNGPENYKEYNYHGFRYFVGTMIYKEYVLFVYPKYIARNLFGFEKTELMSVINRVLIKCAVDNSKGLETIRDSKEVMQVGNDDYDAGGYAVTNDENTQGDLSDVTINGFLRPILNVLNDYLEYGIYDTYEQQIEFNGDGEILWDRTIGEIMPFLVADRPIYFDIKTRRNRISQGDYVTCLHRAIVSDCFRILSAHGLDEILGIPNLELTSETTGGNDGTPGHFGSRENIRYELQKELSQQFVTYKRRILINLLNCIQPAMIDSEETDEGTFSVLGTTCFAAVWEHACAVAFGDQFNVEHSLFQKVFDWTKAKSVWRLLDKNENVTLEATHKTAGKDDTKGRMWPDIISLYGTKLIVLDAKYYKIKWGTSQKEKSEKAEIHDEPGITDIYKQYLYLHAIKKYIDSKETDSGHPVKNCTDFYNALILPAQVGCLSEVHQDTLVARKSTVELGILTEELKAVPIKVRECCADTIFKWYLEGDASDKMKALEELELW